MTLSNNKSRLQNNSPASQGLECAEKHYLEEVNELRLLLSKMLLCLALCLYVCRWCTGDESWLKEADLDFFARGPSETADSVINAASGAVVQVSTVCTIPALHDMP